MGDKVLVVRSNELARQLARRRFTALPEEELLRHHAAVEVLALERDLAEGDPTYRRLVACTMIHHNYSWLTHAHRKGVEAESSPGPRSLIISEPMRAGDRVPLFLDDALAIAATRSVEAAVATPDGYDLRLAGLIDDDSHGLGHTHLGLVYVARLKRPGVAPHERALADIVFCGTGDLRAERDRFEPWSQILIDHLDAL